MAARPSLGVERMTETETIDQRRPNARPFARSFASALIFSVAAFVIVLAIVGQPASSGGAAYLFGTLLGPALIAAAITGFTAWRSTKLWPTWKYALMVTLIALVFLFLSAASKMADQVT